MRTFRTIAGLALVWSGVVLWRERQRRRRSRELLLVVRAAAASRPTATVDDGWVDLPTPAESATVTSSESDPADLESDAVVVDAVDAVDELLTLLARAETPRPAVTLRLRWRDNASSADGESGEPAEPTVPVVRQVRRNPTAAGTTP